MQTLEDRVEIAWTKPERVAIGLGHFMHDAYFSVQNSYTALPTPVRSTVNYAAQTLAAPVRWGWNHLPPFARERFTWIQLAGGAGFRTTQLLLDRYTYSTSDETSVATVLGENTQIWLAATAASEAIVTLLYFASEYKTYRSKLLRFTQRRADLLAPDLVPKAIGGVTSSALNTLLDTATPVPRSAAVWFTGLPFAAETTRFLTYWKDMRDLDHSRRYILTTYAKNRPVEVTRNIHRYAHRLSRSAQYAISFIRRKDLHNERLSK